jgi:hypothetical protein
MMMGSSVVLYCNLGAAGHPSPVARLRRRASENEVEALRRVAALSIAAKC